MSDRNSRSAKRGWLRFSLRTLLVATAGLAALLGLWSNELIRLRRHRNAVARISKLGGMYGSSCEPIRDPREPWWFPVVQDNLYADMEIVSFNAQRNAGLQDDDLQVLNALPKLQVVEMCAPEITDKGFVHLTRIPRLQRVLLQGTQ